MTASMNDLSVTLRTPRTRMYRRGGSLRLVVATVNAPARPAAAEPLPLNLALVVDRSGSMSGEPIEAARRAAAGVVERLGPRDSLSLVSFETNPHVHLDGVQMDDAGRRIALHTLGELVAEGTTNLSGGWLHGAKCVAARMDESKATQNRVVLLSDGFANRGITDTVELRTHAEQLRRRSLFTSTVGIGNGYNPQQLQTLAEYGGGRLHDAERPEEIIEVVLGELAEARATAADDLSLTLAWPRTLSPQLLGVYPTSPTELHPPGHEALDVTLGTMTSGSDRTAVFRLTDLPGGPAGGTLGLSARIRWREPGGDDLRRSGPVEAILSWASGKENQAQTKDTELALVGVRAWQAWVVQQLVDLNRDARYDEAATVLEREIRELRRYCRDVPGSEPLLRQLDATRRRIRSKWSDRTRKEMRLSTYKMLRSETDHRSNTRTGWDTLLSS